MTDHNLWKDDIANRFSPTSLTDVADGDGFIATSVISGTTTKSAWKMSQLDAYVDLRDKLLNGVERPFPRVTTVQRDALINILSGRAIVNLDIGGEIEVYDGDEWIRGGGTGSMLPAAYGEMYQDNDSGSAIDATNKSWVTAVASIFDTTGFVSFLSHANGDRLVINAGGAGHYLLHYSTNFTNSSNNVVTASIRKNETIDPTMTDEAAGSVNQKRGLRVSGLMNLSENDYIDVHLISDTPANTVTVYQSNIHIHRIN